MAVFSLNEVRSLQVENKNTNFTSWPEDFYKSNFAENYCFMGSIISRYEFSTDLFSLPGNNLVDTWSGTTSSHGTVHANNVAAAVGYLSSYPSTIQKFDVTNEVNTSLSGVIPSSDTGYGAFMHVTHSPTAFYSHGGTPSIFGRTNINRMPFSDETMVNIGGGAKGRHNGSTVSSPSDDAGFIFAGEVYGGDGAYDYDEHSTIERFTFSTETDAQLGNTPSTYIRRGTTQNSQYGYLIGGIIIPAPGSPAGDNTNLVSRHEFKTGTHTNSVPSAAFPSPQLRGQVSHGIRRSDYGYYGGGYNRPTGLHRSNIYKLQFETETVYSATNFPTYVSGVQGLLGAASAVKPNHISMQYGYFFGGQPSTGPTTTYAYISKFDLATGDSVPALYTPTAAQKSGAVISNHDYAWRMGGEGPTPPHPARKSWVYRYDFATDENIRSPGDHPVSSGVSEGISFQTRQGDRGYFSQFLFPPDKIIKQENQTETRSDLGFGTPNNLCFNYTGQSTESYGYSLGGTQPDNAKVNDANRFDFSTETYTNIPSALSTAVSSASGAASPQHAHIIGGSQPGGTTNNIEQFEYATETGSDIPANMPYASYWMATVSNTQEAFIQGGVTSPGPPFTLSYKARLSFFDGTVASLPTSLSMSYPGDSQVTNSPFK